jgi:hypothetical protein
MNKTNKKRLNDLFIEQQRLKYPSMPVAMLPPYKGNDNTTNGLTKCIVDFLDWSGHFAERTNTMGRVISTKEQFVDVIGRSRTIGSSKYIPSTGVKGSSDIKATINGRMVAIEVKFGKDRQSEAQKIYQQKVENAHGIYYIAKDFDSFIEWYDVQVLHDLF